MCVCVLFLPDDFEMRTCCVISGACVCDRVEGSFVVFMRLSLVLSAYLQMTFVLQKYIFIALFVAILIVKVEIRYVIYICE